MGRLDGKVALITGAGQGIGAAVARRFAAEGSKVFIVDLADQPLLSLASEIGTSAVALRADISVAEEVRDMIAFAVQRFGRLDIVALNAGIIGPRKSFSEYTVEEYDQVMAVNARGVWLGIKYSFEAMANTGGSIIVTSSTSGIRAISDCSAYVASKHASIGLMRAAAIEGAQFGVRVNSVNPAMTETPMIEAFANQGSPADTNRAVSSTPLGRLGTVAEIANMMLFLASDESSFCTGGVYMVDGGVSAGRAR